MAKEQEKKTKTQKKKSQPKNKNMANAKSKNAKSKKENVFEELSEDELLEEEKKNIRAGQIIMFGVATFFLILIFLKGSSGWLVMHNAMLGVFGLCSIFIPACLYYIVYKSDKYIRKKIDNPNAELHFGFDIEIFKAIIFMISLCGFVQVIYGKNIDVESFSKTIKALFDKGMHLNGAGATASFLAFPLIKFLGSVGARIVSLLILFVTFMLVSGLSIGQFVSWFAHPKKTAGKVAKTLHTDKLSEYDFDEEYDENKNLENEEYPQSQNIFQNTPKKVKLRRRFAEDESAKNQPEEKRSDPFDKFFNEKPKDEPQKDFDLNDSPEDSKLETEGNIEKNQPKKPETAADSLEEMIKKATSEPESKKSKREEKANLMLSVNEEFRKNENTNDDGYVKPPMDFLQYAKHKQADGKELREKAGILQQTFDSFGIKAEIADITMGPTVIRYEVKPAPGVKVSKITNLADDIALNLAASGVRIEAPIPGKSAIGIEVPNDVRDTVSLREILESPAFQNAKSKLSFAVGKDITGNAIVGDIAKMPHVIIAGSTGSGKSVCTNSIIMSILYNASPSEVKLILVDPKIVEFRVYDGIPHLLIPVVTDAKKAAGALNWAVQEMLRRYKVFADSGARDIDDYNKSIENSDSDEEKMPRIVIIIDELADLMMAASKEVEDAICRLAQMARAAGMHLIIATQRPTTDIITGLIKANIPSRIALSVMSGVDSRTILDMTGAEKLLGHGDMLYFPSSIPKPVRVQGCFVSTREVETAVEFIKEQTQAHYSQDIIQAVEENEPVIKSERGMPSKSDSADLSNDDTILVNKAIDIIADSGQASISMLQRRLKLGYARAARIMDELEEMDLIGPSEGAKPRRVKITPETADSYKIKAK